MDLTDSIAPKSDQMNADDLLTGPRTFTIREVRKGSAEQPFDFVLEEFPHDRPYKPAKSMRRVMVAAWGSDASTYAGRRLTLYCDPKVKWGGQEVGGIRISHMSHIDKKLTLALTVTQAKRAPFIVEPLADDAAHSGAEPITVDDVASCTDPATLRDWWKFSGDERRAQIEARVAELTKNEAAE